MQITVVMATYNGERYINKQLESILYQSRTPDEVLIFDDRSSDDTVSRVEAFILEHGLSDRWKLSINERNQGWQKNFFTGLQAAKGDIIFFSDQDDIWLPEKIDNMTRVMKNEGAGCVYGGYTFIDENGMEISGARERKSVAKIKNIKHFNTIVTMGCRMCISREISDIYLNLGVSAYSYDSQCGRLAYLYSKLVIIPETVIMYRIHANNTSGVDNAIEEGNSTKEQRIKEIEDNILWLDRLENYDKKYMEGLKETLIENVIEFQKQRLRYLRKNKGYHLFRIDHTYYRGISMMMGDFAYCHGINRFVGRIKNTFLRCDL